MRDVGPLVQDTSAIHPRLRTTIPGENFQRNKIPKSLTARLLAEAAALDVSAFKPGLPLHVLLGESIDVARVCEHSWTAQVDPETGTVTMPGLELAGEGRLSRSIAAEILALHDLLQNAQTAYVLAIAPPSERTQRAEYVLAELSAALLWLCDDGVVDEKDAKLAAIVDAHRDDPHSEDALASKLADYVGLARQLEAELSEIAAFDLEMIDEGSRLVMALRERSAARVGGRNGESSALLLKRNQLAALLMQKIARVRAAAKYVFRHHEATIRQVTSAYQRRRRAAARRRGTELTAPAIAPAPIPSEPSAPAIEPS